MTEKKKETAEQVAERLAAERVKQNPAYASHKKAMAKK